MTVLTAEALAVGHGRRTVAKDIFLAVEPGEVLCLLGPNGGGKTTLLRTLLGLIPPLAGRVTLGGDDLTALSRADVARRLAYVPQATQGGFGHVALDMVAMGRAARLPLLAAPGKRDRAIALAALERMGIGDLAPRPVTELSGGERQLVLIARALAQEADCMILDEPTASLDFGNQARVLQAVRDLAVSGVAVVLTTHQPEHALLVADRVAMLLPGGAWRPAAPASEAITPETLEATYGVPAVVAAVDTPLGPRHLCAPLVGGSRLASRT